MATFGSAVAAPGDMRPHVARGETARPYITISGLKSWIVTTKTGDRRIVFTTPDGLTLEGPLIDPDGRDIAAALLGVSPPAAAPQTSGSPSATSPGLSLLAAPSKRTADIAPLPPLPDAAQSVATAEAPGTDLGSSADDAGHGEAGSGKAGKGDSDAKVPVLPAAIDAAELLKQAGWFTAWFSAGKPKGGAPVLYFMADPTCVHCAASTEKLAPKVASGDIDLRVILAPILSRQAVYQAASIIQSDSPASTFLSHEKSMVGTTPSTLDVLDPKNIEPDVVRALQRNVAWGRTNNVKGVPFWIYEGVDGPTFAAGRVSDDIINAAKPLPQDLAMETRQ